MAGLFSARSLNKVVLEEQVTVPAESSPGTPSAMKFSEPFDLERRGNMKVEVAAGLMNDWMGIQGDLVNQETGEVVGFYEEVSLYQGTDSDGSWSEGSASGSLHLSALPAGKYVLRTTASYDPTPARVRNYTVRLTHDTPNGGWLCAAFVLLMLGPAFAFFRSHNFETRRWADSNLSE